MIICPPAAIGMLGGGQLGRYTLVAAKLMGYRTIVVDPDPAAPAGVIADEHFVAPYDDAQALDRLAAECAVVTTEFENPPADALRRLAARVVVAPSAEAVAAAQDRIAEKAFLAGHGFAVAPYTVVAGAGDVDAAVSWMVGPCLLKTARLGYDGKGQAPIGTATELRQAWDALGGEPAVLERRVPLDHELSVVVARAADGRTATYPVVENHHVGGILDLSVVPARVEPAVARRAEEVGVAVADELAYVGVLAVELFVSDGDVLVNELAPRPHNSGHWTLDAAVTSQFQQQVRAVCGQALGSTTMTAPAAAMVNLLGDSWSGGEPDWSTILADPAARLHLYGKTTARPARKMGHVTVLADDADAAEARALDLRTRLSRSA